MSRQVEGTTASRDCMARMRAILAPLAAPREPSAKWAFELCARLARRPTSASNANAIRIALDAIRSPAGRACVESATAQQRARWRAALETLGYQAAALMPSRVPGEDDETNDNEAQHDPV